MTNPNVGGVPQPSEQTTQSTGKSQPLTDAEVLFNLVNDAVTALGDEAKVAEESAQEFQEDVDIGTKSTHKSEKEEEVKRQLMGAPTTNQASNLPPSHTGRTGPVPNSSQSPNLPPPRSVGEKIPQGEEGFGNPWLAPSLSTALFLSWLEILPILMEIKLEEAETVAREIQSSYEMTEAKTEAILKKASLDAEKMRTEAYSQFIQAGIAVAGMAMQLGAASVQTIGSVAQAGVNFGTRLGGQFASGALQKGIGGNQTKLAQLKAQYNSMANKDSPAGQKLKSNIANTSRKLKGLELLNGIATGAGQGAFNVNLFNQSNMQLVSQLIQQQTQALSNITEGVSKMIQAELHELAAQQEYIQTMFDHMQQQVNKMRDSAEASKREAGELFGSFIQAMLTYIQQMDVFAIKPR